jgi:hypothetical protein
MRRLWVLPLAAILCGRPVNPPRLKAPLPAAEGCAEAQKFFLLAYAYRLESPAQSRRLLDQAGNKLEKCGEPLLQLQINELKGSAL